MDIKRQLTRLDERYMQASSKEEEAELMAQIQDLIDSNPDRNDELVDHHAKDLLMIAKAMRLSVTLEPIMDLVNFKSISTQYFGRTPSWFYQRLNGNVVHGMRSHFSADEIAALKAALKDVAAKIGSVADSI